MNMETVSKILTYLLVVMKLRIVSFGYGYIGV